MSGPDRESPLVKLLVTTSNKCHASSNKCLTSSNKKLQGHKDFSLRTPCEHMRATPGIGSPLMSKWKASDDSLVAWDGGLVVDFVPYGCETPSPRRSVDCGFDRKTKGGNMPGSSC